MGTSKYEGVSWNEKRNLWQTKFYINGQQKTFYFDNEFDASKKSNQLCRKMGIPPPKPQIYESPTQKKEKITSQYKGVCWDTKSRKWRVQLSLKGEKPKYGGYFKDELDAAKRANQLCDELGIALWNPEIIISNGAQNRLLPNQAD